MIHSAGYNVLYALRDLLSNHGFELTALIVNFFVSIFLTKYKIFSLISLTKTR